MLKNQSIKTHRKRTACYSLIATAVLFVFSLVLVPNTLPNRSFAEELTVTPSLTISPSNTLAFSVQPGQFNSGSQTLTVKTSNYTGYTLTIAPTSGTSTALSNVNVSGATLPTITLPNGSSSITSSGFTSAGYGFSIDGTNYKPVNNGSIIKSTGNGSAGTDTISFTIGAKAESNTAAGVYQKQFTLTATANAVAYSITYNANAGSDIVTNMPTSPQTSGSVSGTDLTLASEVPERTGYTFLGWSTDSSATTATYSAGDSYSLDQTTGNRITLYAIWKINTHTLTISLGTGVSSVTIDGTAYHNGDTVSLEENTTHNIDMTFASSYEFDSWSVSGTGSSVASTSTQSTTFTMGTADTTLTANGKVVKVYLQNWTGCDSMSVGDTITLYDNRDEQAYTVSKYNMGNNTAKCWMSNLNLGAVSLASGVTQLDNTNTNLPNDSSKFISASTFMAWDRTTSGTATSYTDPKFTPVTASNASNGLAADTYGNKYGTLYNYAAASANTINAASGANNDNAQYSLCPAGWRLPTGGSSGEFQAFYNANSPTGTTMQSDYGFSLAGYFDSSTPSYQGSLGLYWSSTRYNGGSMYRLYFNSSSVYPASYNSRYYGYSVRCIEQDYHTLTIATGTGVESVEIDGVSYENGDTVNLKEDSTHTIDMAFQSGYEFDSWSVSGTGSSVASTSTQSTTFTMGTADSTLTANGKAYLQNWTGCSSLAVGEKITLYDNRDEQAYTVSKYKMSADGSQTACWMSNLNLGAVSLASGVTQLDNTNTNLPNDSSKFISASTFMAWDRTTSGTATSYTDPKFTPVTASNASNGLAADTYGNKYGTLYNYAAASAGTYVYASGSGTGDAQYSLCPSGWRLPTGGSSGEFQAFYNANSPTGTTLQSDYGFSLAGYFSSSTPSRQGSYGLYWSSTRYGGRNMYRLYFDSSYVSPASNDLRYYGYSVRCIKE